MLYRKAYDKLLEWKNQQNKKALCIMGARQIGKTTVIRQFGEDQYECFVEINFITDTDAVMNRILRWTHILLRCFHLGSMDCNLTLTI